MYEMNHHAGRMSEQNDRSPRWHRSVFPAKDGGGSVKHGLCIEFSLSSRSRLVSCYLPKQNLLLSVSPDGGNRNL